MGGGGGDGGGVGGGGGGGGGGCGGGGGGRRGGGGSGGGGGRLGCRFGADVVWMSAPGNFWGLDGTEVLCFRRWEEV